MKKLLCTAALVCGMLTVGSGEVNAASMEAVSPEYNSHREERVYDVSDWVAKEPTGKLQVGDWNQNGKIELEDAKEVLKAALQINETEHVDNFKICTRAHNQIELEDAQDVLKMALKIMEPESVYIYEPDFKPLYQSLEFAPYDAWKIECMFKNKESLKDWVKRFVDNQEFLSYVEDMDESLFEDYGVLMTSDFVYAESLDDVGVDKVQLKPMIEGFGVRSYIADEGKEILDNKNQLYTEFTLVANCPESGNQDLIEYNEIGDEKVKADIYVQDVKILEEGYKVISSMEELNEYKTFLKTKLEEYKENWHAPDITQEDRNSLQYTFWEKLQLEESFFEESVLIVNVTNVDYYTEKNHQSRITYTKENGNICFHILKEKFKQHTEYPEGFGRYGYMITDLLWVDKDFIEGYQVTVETQKKHTYVDYAPEQTVYIVEPKTDTNWGSLLLTNEEERKEILQEFVNCYKEDNDDYKALYDVLKCMDVSKQDYLLIIGGNRGDVWLQTPEPEQVYLTIRPGRIQAVSNYQAMTYPPGKDAVILIPMEKGTLENCSVTNKLGR